MATIRETHIATVTDNNDPEKRFRIKVACASLMGVDSEGEAVEFGGWIEPTFPALLSDDGKTVTGGFFMIPSPGAEVELDIAVSSDFDESPGQTGITNPDPKWRGSLFHVGDTIPEEFAKNYPNRFGFRSATGHVFYFDDSKGDEGKIVLQSRPNEAGQATVLSMENDGSFQIITSNGMMVFMNAKAGEITILDSNLNMFAMKPDGMTLMAKGGTIDMNEAGINILSAGNLHLQGNSITLQALAIALGDGTAALPLLHGAPGLEVPSTIVKTLA